MCSPTSSENHSHCHSKKRDHSICCLLFLLLTPAKGESVLLLEHQWLGGDVGQAWRAFISLSTECPRGQFSLLNVLVILIHRLTYICRDIFIKILIRLPSCSHSTKILCTLRFFWFCFLLNRFQFQGTV